MVLVRGENDVEGESKNGSDRMAYGAIEAGPWRQK